MPTAVSPQPPPWDLSSPHVSCACNPRQVLSSSWELQQVLRTAPRATAAAINRLSQPKRQQHAGDTCASAHAIAGHLEHQRKQREARQRQEQQYECAKQEALAGWLRARQQVRHSGNNRGVWSGELHIVRCGGWCDCSLFVVRRSRRRLDGCTSGRGCSSRSRPGSVLTGWLSSPKLTWRR